MANYYRCNECEAVFEESDAPIHSENITDNYYSNYYVCPECGSSNIEEITEEEYEKAIEEEEDNVKR